MSFIKISEQPSLYDDLEKKSVREILEDINTEDQKVALAVQKTIPQIEKLVSLLIPRMLMPFFDVQHLDVCTEKHHRKSS